MPRKPSSVFVIVDIHADTGGSFTGQMPLQAYREPLDGTTVEDIVEAHYSQHPVGSRIFVVEDTKVDAHQVRLQLEPIDDPRLDEEGEGPVG